MNTLIIIVEDALEVWIGGLTEGLVTVTFPLGVVAIVAAVVAVVAMVAVVAVVAAVVASVVDFGAEEAAEVEDVVLAPTAELELELSPPDFAPGSVLFEVFAAAAA
jgi:hypothetical protein